MNQRPNLPPPCAAHPRTSTVARALAAWAARRAAVRAACRARLPPPVARVDERRVTVAWVRASGA